MTLISFCIDHLKAVTVSFEDKLIIGDLLVPKNIKIRSTRSNNESPAFKPKDTIDPSGVLGA